MFRIPETEFHIFKLL